MPRFAIILIFTFFALVLTACQPAPEPPRLQITPFPTMTPGRVVRGDLLPPDVLPEGQISPATAVAIAALPTATQDFSTCPPLSDEAVIENSPPENPEIVIEEIIRFLQQGGAFSVLSETLRSEWEMIGETGAVRDDIDLTGEGRGEIIVSYVPPQGEGQLLVIGCRAGAYEILYEARAGASAAPSLLTVGDMNRDGRNDLLFTTQQCALNDEGELDPEACEYTTRLISWQSGQSRFANLLRDDVITYDLPEASDVDEDEVSEVVVRLTNRGTSATGPLRTGLNVYDWNGEAYVLSIVQYDAPRFKIQVLHEADRAIARGETGTAIALYNVALEDGDLGYWYDDEVESLRSYTLYRLLIAQASAQSPEQNNTMQALSAAYPDPANAPVYAALAQTFFLAFQLTPDMSAACQSVRDVITTRPEALDLLNRYGSRSPTYTVQDLCPF